MPGLLSITGENEDMKCNNRKFRLTFFRRSLISRIRIFILVISALSIFTATAYSQIRGTYSTLFETDIGYGFPESICFKVKFGNDIQAGFFQSFDTHGFGSSGFEIYYRFGNKSRLLDQKPWYVMGGLAGYVFDVDYVKEYEFLIYPRAGRSFYFSKYSGINLDMGLGFPFGRNTGESHTIFPVLPSGSMGLFLRF